MMAFDKCPKCGAIVQIENEESVLCGYCGIVQKQDDSKTDEALQRFHKALVEHVHPYITIRKEKIYNPRKP